MKIYDVAEEFVIDYLAAIELDKLGFMDDEFNIKNLYQAPITSAVLAAQEKIKERSFQIMLNILRKREKYFNKVPTVEVSDTTNKD